ncbi:LacI family DNA-binding transcriptional regulator [Niveispirillum sp.]|uniref:LacI family DNA-binding transcriptional regulator n=1 Tax=Niveispirillum sp. TaxID=1917217 RepID=UPI001B5C2EB3|nr:LacI family DNA-binding transcriptional regulator [Niveispirillum sp.]MBP7337009.1 LacI family DNA-binding transcriptional regulator [Niveispirillum sp.]
MAPIIKMSDIARMAGVSVSTVSRALAGSSLVPEAKREEILALARDHGYVINEQARNLRLKKTRTIGVVIPLGHEVGQLISDPFFIELFGRLADEITARDYNVLLTKVAKPEPGWLDRLIQSRKADGLIVIGQSDQHEALNAVARDYLPLVVWGAHLPSQLYCSVGSDNIGGARVAVEHLIRLGRRRIAFLGVPNLPEVGLRFEGYRRALSAAGIAEDAALTAPAHFTVDTAYDTVRGLIEAGTMFDAIFAVSDVIAIAAIKALTAAGLRVPDDVAVVGFDDINIAAYVNPPLTSVRQDLARGARVMIDLLFRRMEEEDTPSATMPAELVIRKSCGA